MLTITLWKYSAPQYPWISENMGLLRRDFLIQDLMDAVEESDIEGVVTVQARQALAETRWLLDLARTHDLIRAVVGWVALTGPKVDRDLEHFSTHAKLKSVRHVLHDEPDDLYILREDFNSGIKLLKDFDLHYDLLIFERHLPQTIQFVDRHPNQIFILDHIAKPRIREGMTSPWRENLTELARRENVFCKLSAWSRKQVGSPGQKRISIPTCKCSDSLRSKESHVWVGLAGPAARQLL